jgi:hypothetical protein
MLLRLLVLLAITLPCVAQQPSLADALKQAALPVVLDGGQLTDTGGALLQQEIAASRFVLIGESHLSTEIPQFTSAVCNAMHPDAYAVEAGPQAAQFVRSQLHDPQRIAHMRSMLQVHPENMAFLNVQEENDLAATCAASSHNPQFALWGLDQEFLGAGGALLDSMAATHPGPRALAAIHVAQAKEREAETLAHASGDYLKLYLVSSTDAEVQTITEAVAADGTPATNRVWHAFTDSRHIYKLNLAGDPDSNRVRNLLMKQELLSDYLPIASEKPETRVLFKFGAMHMGKGFSPLHQREIGNAVAELADVQEAKSLHIMIFGAHGTGASPQGYRKPLKIAPFDLATDKDEKYIAPALAAMFPSGVNKNTMTLFDLRKLRFKRGLALPDEWTHLIYSYDLLVLIPEVTPGTMIE